MKGKSLGVLAVKDPEVDAFVRRYGSTLAVAKVRTERKRFKKGNIYVAIKSKNNSKTSTTKKRYLHGISCQKSKERV